MFIASSCSDKKEQVEKFKDSKGQVLCLVDSVWTQTLYDVEVDSSKVLYTNKLLRVYVEKIESNRSYLIDSVKVNFTIEDIPFEKGDLIIASIDTLDEIKVLSGLFSYRKGSFLRNGIITSLKRD